MQPCPQLQLVIAGELPLFLSGGTNAISFISDRHSDLRDTSGFEPPPSKGLGGNFIKNRVTGALRHHGIRDFPGHSIDNHDANTASSNIGVLCLVWILGQGSTHCHGLGSR